MKSLLDGGMSSICVAMLNRNKAAAATSVSVKKNRILVRQQNGRWLAMLFLRVNKWKCRVTRATKICCTCPKYR